MQVSSPVTAAGPRRICTGFPIMPYIGTRIIYTAKYHTSFRLSMKNHGLEKNSEPDKRFLGTIRI